MYFFFLNFKNFRNSRIEIVKKIKPIILELGQIDKDLKVGDRKIENEKIKSIFFSILLNLNDKHL